MSGDIRRAGPAVRDYPADPRLIARQSLPGFLDLGGAAFALVGDEGSSFLHERQAPAREPVQGCDGSGDTEVERFAVPRLLRDLLGPGMDRTYIGKAESLSELVYDLQPFES